MDVRVYVTQNRVYTAKLSNGRGPYSKFQSRSFLQVALVPKIDNYYILLIFLFKKLFQSFSLNH